MNEFRIQCKLMGSAFELILVHDAEEQAWEWLNTGVNEIKRIEDLLSEFREETYTTLLNRNAGIAPVNVSDEVWELVQRCQRISAFTRGAFDITVGPLKKLYNFKNSVFAFPEKSLIQSTLQQTGYQKIILSEKDKTIFLSEDKMHISFAAVGKGYAADCVKKLWIKLGVTSGVINASGDLTAFGKRKDGTDWKVGIAHPDNRDEVLYHLPVDNLSVATSGDYEQFFLYNGTRYSHTINPLTGYPVKGIKSVTIFSPSAELSDALATAVFVMGVGTGLHFINQLPGTHCIIVDAGNQSHFSQKLDLVHEE